MTPSDSGKKEAPEQFVPNSSFLELVTYDATNKVMTVTFKTGQQRKYLQTFPAIYANFKQSVNHGVYYSKLIKGKLNSSVVQSHNVGTKRQSRALNKQTEKPYGSQSLNRRVRAAAYGKSTGSVSDPGNIPDAL